MTKTHLSHAGIKGMKWGVRRFQYEDGSLTPAGKKRYGTKENMYKEINKEYGSVENMKNIQDRNMDNLARTGKVMEDSSKVFKDAASIGKNPTKSKVINKADYSKLSDDELRKRINRLNMERNYGELTGDTKRVRSGGDWTRETLQTAGILVGMGATIASMIYTINQTKNLKTNNKKG